MTTRTHRNQAQINTRNVNAITPTTSLTLVQRNIQKQCTIDSGLQYPMETVQFADTASSLRSEVTINRQLAMVVCHFTDHKWVTREIRRNRSKQCYIWWEWNNYISITPAKTIGIRFDGKHFDVFRTRSNNHFAGRIRYIGYRTRL